MHALVGEDENEASCISFRSVEDKMFTTSVLILSEVAGKQPAGVVGSILNSQ